MSEKKAGAGSYAKILARIFADGWKPGTKEIPFAREDIEKKARSLSVPVPKNLGDVIYSFRYRKDLPEEILAKTSKGLTWVIEGAGRAKYRFKLVNDVPVVPRPDFAAIKIPDATPEIVSAYTLSDEQALLAIVRYNRLIDIFLGITAYSMQNHLRTTVSGYGQIEVDELYVGINKSGTQFIIPVQAKGGKDRLSVIQTQQDIQCCQEKFPHLICRAISTQFMTNGDVAMFELRTVDGSIKVVDERHFALVPADQISAADLRTYANRS